MPADPLANLLPAADPLAPFVPINPPPLPASVSAVEIPQREITAETTSPEEMIQPDAAPPMFAAADLATLAGASGGSGETRIRRRKSRSLAGPLMGLFVIALIAGVGACAYILANGYRLTSDGRVIAGGDNSAARRVINQPRQNGNADAPQAPVDRVMGQAATADKPAASPQPTPPNGPSSRSLPAIPAEPPAEPNPAQPSMQPQPAAANDPAPVPTPEPQPDEQSAAAERSALLGSVTQALRAGELPAASMAISQIELSTLSAAGKEQLQRYGLLVELAEHYTEGIRRGMTKLRATETFELAPGLEVLVAETSAERISLRLNGRIKSYILPELPLVLAHRLADFGLPADDPVAKAGRAAFQSLWPRSTVGHRLQAFDWWNELSNSQTEVDVTGLEAIIRELFDIPPTE